MGQIPGAGADEIIDVYRQTIGPLYEFISRRLGGNRSLAEDFTQETFLRAVQHWSADGMPRQPQAWLHTVARNLIINDHRRRAPQSISQSAFNAIIDTQHSLHMHASGPQSSTRAELTPETSATIHWALGQLPARSARLIEAFHIEHKSIRQIANAAGLTERAVQSRLDRARKTLRKKLAPLISDDDTGNSPNAGNDSDAANAANDSRAKREQGGAS